MIFHIYLAFLFTLIVAENVSSGSYLQMDVSSNPILPGLTKTLTMSCRIRADSHGAAPGLADKSDALLRSGSPILAAIEGREKESDELLRKAVEKTPNSNDGSPAESGDEGLVTGSATTMPQNLWRQIFTTDISKTAEYITATPLTTEVETSVITSNTPSASVTVVTTSAHGKTTITAPTAATPTSKPQTNMTSSSVEISHLMSIVITKANPPGEDETVAMVSPFGPAAAEGTYVDILQVNGSVFHDTQINGELGYLTLTWRIPQDDQVGKYTCEASALAHSGHPAILTGSLEILARQPGINDLVPLIIDLEERISQLEHENQELKHRLDLLKA